MATLCQTSCLLPGKTVEASAAGVTSICSNSSSSTICLPFETAVMCATSTHTSQHEPCTTILYDYTTFSAFAISGGNVITTSTTTATANTTSNSSGKTSVTSTGTPTPIGVNTSSNKIAPGAAAGIGIGCAIAGAVIASLILLCLFARYRKRNREPVGYAHHLPDYAAGGARQEKAQSLTAPNGAALVESYLPQPAEDDAIKGELSRLRDSIKNHTQSYYHTAPMAAQMVDQNRLKDISRAMGVSAAHVQELLLEPSSRISAIRLYISWVVLSRCLGHGTSAPSLLPTEIAAFAAQLEGLENAPAREITLASKWKVLSGALLQGRYGQPHAAEDPAHEHSIRQAVLTADSVLAPFVNAAPDADKRLRHLENIVRRASQLAFLLFSQPSSWAFEWTTGAGMQQSGQVVIFPGLLETVSDEGIVRRPPRVFSEPEVAAV